MKDKTYWILCCLSLIFNCSEKESEVSLLSMLSGLDSIHGNKDYLNSPYVTAGDRVYMVGHQDGTFPDLGWHVQGEMGGIWNHPIKLMDGFVLGISNDADYWCLTDADMFINYPVANLHHFLFGDSLEATRVQYVPEGQEGVVVEYTITNHGSKQQNLTLDFTAMIDLMPVWLSDSLGIKDGSDLAAFDDSEDYWVAKDSLNDWYAVIGTDADVKKATLNSSPCKYDRKGNGKDASLSIDISPRPGEQKVLHFFIGGSYQSESQAINTYKFISESYNELLKEKINRYQEIKETAAIDIPDKGLKQLYTWTKYNTAWLMREVPEQGRGLSAGIPDYPWWFGTDAGYALRGLLATGQHQEVKKTIELILKLSQEVNDNGRIMHEASTNGVVFNPGNLNTTPYFIYLLWEYYKWTGDKDFLEKHYPDVQKGLQWVLSQDQDNNGFPDGAGMMEIHGLSSEMIDVAVYTEAALGAAGAMALEVGDQKGAAIYMEKANNLAKRINTEWWVESSKSFADFKATKAQTLELIDAAIVRADTLHKPWAVAELKARKQEVSKLPENQVQGHVIHHNWVVNTPMEFGLASQDKAEKALKTARKYTNRFGMYVTGIDRDEAQDTSSKWKAFSYVGAVMTLPTGVQAIAEANYGHADRALDYLQALENSFSYALPGSMYEVSPDYGMIAQAWNIYAVAIPIISYFYGVQPMAHEQTVAFQPLMPSGWEEASLNNLIVGNNKLSLEIKRNQYTFTQTNPEWQIVLILKDKSQTVYVNDKVQDIRHSGNYMHIRLTGESNVVRLEESK